MHAGQDAQIVTPEAVALEIDAAGVGSRFIAIAIDTLIQLVPLLLIAYAVDQTNADEYTKIAITAFVSFVGFWVYFAAFEILWNGQTPGKRAQGLRVVSADGRAESPRQAVIRNLVRGVDLLPGFYMVGIISMMSTRRSQRLGDLAGNTLVLRERKTTAPKPLALHAPVGISVELDTSGLTEAEYQLVRSFLTRRHDLPLGARNQLAHQLARTIGVKVPGSASWTQGPEAYLEEVARRHGG